MPEFRVFLSLITNHDLRALIRRQFGDLLRGDLEPSCFIRFSIETEVRWQLTSIGNFDHLFLQRVDHYVPEVADQRADYDLLEDLEGLFIGRTLQSDVRVEFGLVEFIDVLKNLFTEGSTVDLGLDSIRNRFCSLILFVGQSGICVLAGNVETDVLLILGQVLF